MKKCHLFLVAVVAAIFGVLTSCTPTSSSPNDRSSQNDDETEDASSKGWKYFKTVDDSTNEPSFYAMLKSTNSQPSTDGGETKLVMLVSYTVFNEMVNVNTVTFGFENDNYRFAQLTQLIGGGFLANFNGGPVLEDWSYLKEGAQDRGLVIAPNRVGNDNSARSFISKLKNSNICKIQVDIENVGMRTFEFDCSGLQWDFDR